MSREGLACCAETGQGPGRTRCTSGPNRRFCREMVDGRWQMADGIWQKADGRPVPSSCCRILHAAPILTLRPDNPCSTGPHPSAGYSMQDLPSSRGRILHAAPILVLRPDTPGIAPALPANRYHTPGRRPSIGSTALPANSRSACWEGRRVTFEGNARDFREPVPRFKISPSAGHSCSPIRPRLAAYALTGDMGSWPFPCMA